MNWIVFCLIVIWLGVLSWFDIRTKEIPHSLWVLFPIICAGLYRVWLEGWPLVLLAMSIAAASERKYLAKTIRWRAIEQISTWIPLIGLAVCLSFQDYPLSTLAIIGFWAAWEWQFWGGADAVCAITVCLIWPGRHFLMAFLLLHVFVVLFMGIFSLVREHTIRLHRLPGVPILLGSVLFMALW